MSERLRTFGLWMHALSAKYPPLTWVIHAIMALPCIGLVALFGPWIAPACVFGYREGEQMWFRYLTKQKMLWVDHVMDVLAPGLAGWWLLS